VNKKRKRFPITVETEVLVVSKRRCAFCFGLDGDTTEKEGQIAHVDRDPSNVKSENAAWLCTKHHARYDSRSRQTKGHTPEELRAYQEMLINYLASPRVWPDAAKTSGVLGPGVSLEVFDRRIPIYRTTLDFVRLVVQGGKLDLQPILKFAADTDEALFLFDDQVAEYLASLFKKALRLRTVSIMIEPPDRRTPNLIQEEVDLMLWFSTQFDKTRSLFAPYLRLDPRPANKKMETDG
jgi:hypothetical protein